MIKIFFVIILANFAGCQRRLVGGVELKNGRPYMVYIVWEIANPKRGTFWQKGGHDERALCGGVLLNPLFIITSAACLFTKPRQYVVAGYTKYVPNAKNDSDKCLDIARRRIIWKCVYTSMKFVKWDTEEYFKNKKRWTANDIGIAKLDKIYDFSDTSYLKHCSYIPKAIQVSFVAINPGENVLVLGWGSPRYHRPKDYYYDVNQKFLMGITTVVISNDACKKAYSGPHGIPVNIKICTDGPSKVSLNGTFLGRHRRVDSKYISNNTTLNDTKTEDQPMYAIDIEKITDKDKIVFFNTPEHAMTRRNGPCENDHGGPIVIWRGGVEYVAGIIVGYLVNKNMECNGPYLYRGLYVEKEFIFCTTTEMDPTKHPLKGCDKPPQEKGYRTIEEHIEWN